MKVLVDEDLPQDLRLYLSGHEAFTVWYMGWSGLDDATVLEYAEKQGFEVLVTADQGIHFQQNLTKRKLGLLMLMSQDWPVLLEHAAEIADAIGQVQPGTKAVLRFEDA